MKDCLDTLNFKTYADLSKKLKDGVIFSEDKNISVIARYKDAKEIIKELVNIGLDLYYVNIEPEEFGEYFDEFIIDVSDSNVSCECFMVDGKYLRSVSGITFVSNECSSKVLQRIESPVAYAYEITE